MTAKKRSTGVTRELSALRKMIEKLAKSNESKKIKAQVKKVFKTGKKEGLEKTRSLRGDLAKGLKAISKELNKIAGSIEK